MGTVSFCFSHIKLKNLTMQLVLLLLWIKAAQGLYLGRKKSESMNEDDVSILQNYNAVAHFKSEEDDLSMLPFHMEEKDSKPTKRKNLKKMISKGKLGAVKAGESSSYDLHGMEIMGSSDTTFGAKFVPIAPVDGYEAEDDSETEDVSVMEDAEEDSDEEVAKGSDEIEEDSENEVAEGSEDESSEDEEGSEGESEGSDSSDSSDSSSSDSDSSSSDSDSSSSDSEGEEKVPDYYNGESDYVYTYEWDDTDKQVTGSDYEYSYEWAYKEENHEEHY